MDVEAEVKNLADQQQEITAKQKDITERIKKVEEAAAAKTGTSSNVKKAVKK